MGIGFHPFRQQIPEAKRGGHPNQTSEPWRSGDRSPAAAPSTGRARLGAPDLLRSRARSGDPAAPRSSLFRDVLLLLVSPCGGQQR